MKWIKTRDSGETQNVLETVQFSESVYLGLCGNQEKWSMKFPNHRRLVLKIKHVLWANSSNGIGWDTFLV